jgi:hypothetical protein
MLNHLKTQAQRAWRVVSTQSGRQGLRQAAADQLDNLTSGRALQSIQSGFDNRPNWARPRQTWNNFMGAQRNRAVADATMEELTSKNHATQARLKSELAEFKQGNPSKAEITQKETELRGVFKDESASNTREAIHTAVSQAAATTGRRNLIAGMFLGTAVGGGAVMLGGLAALNGSRPQATNPAVSPSPVAPQTATPPVTATPSGQWDVNGANITPTNQKSRAQAPVFEKKGTAGVVLARNPVTYINGLGFSVPQATGQPTRLVDLLGQAKSARVITPGDNPSNQQMMFSLVNGDQRRTFLLPFNSRSGDLQGVRMFQSGQKNPTLEASAQDTSIEQVQQQVADQIQALQQQGFTIE